MTTLLLAPTKARVRKNGCNTTATLRDTLGRGLAALSVLVTAGGELLASRATDAGEVYSLRVENGPEAVQVAANGSAARQPFWPVGLAPPHWADFGSGFLLVQVARTGLKRVLDPRMHSGPLLCPLWYSFYPLLNLVSLL